MHEPIYFVFTKQKISLTLSLVPPYIYGYKCLVHEGPAAYLWFWSLYWSRAIFISSCPGPNSPPPKKGGQNDLDISGT